MESQEPVRRGVYAERKFWLLHLPQDMTAWNAVEWMGVRNLRPASPREVLAWGERYYPPGPCLNDKVVSFYPLTFKGETWYMILQCHILDPEIPNPHLAEHYQVRFIPNLTQKEKDDPATNRVWVADKDLWILGVVKE